MGAFILGFCLSQYNKNISFIQDIFPYVKNYNKLTLEPYPHPRKKETTPQENQPTHSFL